MLACTLVDFSAAALLACTAAPVLVLVVFGLPAVVPWLLPQSAHVQAATSSSPSLEVVFGAARLYGFTFSLCSMHLAVGSIAIFLAIPVFHLAGCKTIVCGLAESQLGLLDMIFLAAILPFICLPSFVLHGVGGAAFIYIYVALLWCRKLPAPPPKLHHHKP